MKHSHCLISFFLAPTLHLSYLFPLTFIVPLPTYINLTFTYLLLFYLYLPTSIVPLPTYINLTFAYLHHSYLFLPTSIVPLPTYIYCTFTYLHQSYLYLPKTIVPFPTYAQTLENTPSHSISSYLLLSLTYHTHHHDHHLIILCRLYSQSLPFIPLSNFLFQTYLRHLEAREIQICPKQPTPPLLLLAHKI